MSSLVQHSCLARMIGDSNKVIIITMGIDQLSLKLCCSCSQQEAYEEPEQPNGLYALHLLKHIGRNERIELILMDVARGK